MSMVHLTAPGAFSAHNAGVHYINQPIPLPLTSDEEMLDYLWRGVTPRTKVIFISHITSPTALIFPLAKICQRARAAGIITVVDGAHAPIQSKQAHLMCLRTTN